MSSKIRDKKLDEYIGRIKESNNSNNKLLNYKKALGRLEDIKTDYNKLYECLKNSKTPGKPSKKNTDKKVSIEKIVNELERISKEMDSDENDMLELIDNYVQYKLLLDNLEIESEKVKNEFYKVEKEKNKIVVHKLNEEDIV